MRHSLWLGPLVSLAVCLLLARHWDVTVGTYPVVVMLGAGVAFTWGAFANFAIYPYIAAHYAPQVSVTTRTFHYDRLTMSGTGYNDSGRADDQRRLHRLGDHRAGGREPGVRAG